MSKKHRLGDLQLAIMRVLWERGEASVTEVHAAIHPERGLATTTIATMLRKMEQKGVVTHHTEGRVFIYRPTVAESAVHRSMVGELVDRLFDGDASALVSHLLAEGSIDPDELAHIRAAVEAKARSGARHTRRQTDAGAES